MKEKPKNKNDFKRMRRSQLVLICAILIICILIMGASLGCVYWWGEQIHEKIAAHYQTLQTAEHADALPMEEIQRLQSSQTILLICSQGFFILVLAGLISYIFRQIRDEHKILTGYHDLSLRQEKLYTSHKDLSERLTALHGDNEKMRSDLNGLNEDKKILEHVLDQLPYPVYILDSRKQAVLFTNALTREARNQTTPYSPFIHDRFTPESQRHISTTVDKVIHSGQKECFEVSCQTDDGEEHHYEIHTLPLNDDDGEVSHVLEYVLDITEGKRRESRGQALNRQLQETAGALNDKTRQLETEQRRCRTLEQSWQKKYGELENQNQEFREREQTTREGLEELERKCLELNDRLREAQEDEQKLKSNNQELDEKCRDLDRQNQSLQQSREELNTRYEQLEQKDQSLQENEQKLSATIQRLEGRNEELQMQIETMQQNEQQLRSELERLRSAHGQLEGREQQLHDETRKYREIYEHLVGLTLLIDRQGIIQESNAKSRIILGQDPETLKNRSLSDFFAPETHSAIRSGIQELFQSGRAFRQHHLLRSEGGKQMEIELTCKPIRTDQQQSPRLALAVVYDITSHRRQIRQLETSEKEKSRILDNLAEHIVYHDPDHRIIWANRAAAESVGKQPEELIGEYCYKLWQDYEQPCPGCPVSRTLESGEAGVGEQQTPEGHYWHIGSRPVRDRDGNLIGAVEITMDITPQKKSRQQLLDYQQQLRQMASRLSIAEERERLRVASQLHDQIGQTLSLAKMNLDTLQGLAPTEGCASSLRELGQMLQQTLNDTRTLTFELGSPILYEYGLEPALEDMLEQRFKAIPEIKTRFRSDQQAKPLADDIRILLYQVVRELLMNVIKHADASSVEVAVQREQDSIGITVQDNGAGFQPDEGTLYRRNGGFGLFSIRERLNHLGGGMDIQSRPGQGTRVRVTAPLGNGSTASSPEGET